ncbi:MAG TPA: hypothetical protein QF753_07910 [Victivallales bacterium]|nr:hypothetical protein [Victivallales bacterium]
MKIIIVLLTFLSVTTCMYAKPVVAQMESMIEGQMVYEVPLNSQVKKGQLVEKVDTAQYKGKVEKDLDDIAYYKKLYGVNSRLYRTRSVSLITLLKSKEQIGDAVANYREDRALLDHCKIYAPFNGKVTKIIAYPGSGIGDGNLIMEITKNAA